MNPNVAGRLNKILLTAALRAEQINAMRAFDKRAQENAQRLDKERE